MIVIRLYGHSREFDKVEQDGTSIKFGKWKQDGEFWLLELTDVQRLVDAAEEISWLIEYALERDFDLWDNKDDAAYGCRHYSEFYAALAPFEVKA